MSAALHDVVGMARTKVNRAPLQRIYLREWRRHHKLSQEALAALLDISHTTLGRIERGQIPYNQRFLEAAAAALGCEPAELIVRDPSRPDPMWKVWDSLSQPQREQALAVIHALGRTGTDDR